MANAVTPGDILQIQPWWTFQEQAGTTVLHFLVNPGSAAVLDTEIAAFLSPLWQGECQDVIGGDVYFRGISVRILRGGATFPTVLGPALNLEGTFGGGPLPGQVSGLITKKSADGSKKGRGRSYIPFPSEDANGPDGNPTADYLLVLIAFATQTMTTLNATGVAGLMTADPVIANRPIPGLVKAITSTIPRPRWATQRRRGDYGKPNVSPFQ